MRTTRLLLVPAACALVASALAPAASDAAGHASPRRTDPYAVTIAASTTQLTLGKKVVISGKVSPGHKGAEVLLQKRFPDEKWKTKDTTTLDGKGRYVFTDKPSTMTPRKYRVIKPASGHHAKGTSKAVSVTMYQWHDLSALEIRQQDRVYGTTATINTVEFPNSFVGYLAPAPDDTGSVDWNLDRKCSTLKATFGMDDNADVDSSVQIDVDADGTSIYTGSFQLLQSEAKTLDINGVFRLGFAVTSLSTSTPRPAIATPRVLCSF